jgi:hypothetical protein
VRISAVKPFQLDYGHAFLSEETSTPFHSDNAFEILNIENNLAERDCILISGACIPCRPVLLWRLSLGFPQSPGASLRLLVVTLLALMG